MKEMWGLLGSPGFILSGKVLIGSEEVERRFRSLQPGADLKVVEVAKRNKMPFVDF